MRRFGLAAAALFAAVSAGAKVELIDRTVDLEKSELLYSFDTFDPADWTIVKHPPKWTVNRESIVGGGPDEPRHGQIFYKTPVKGDVVMEFDAKLIAPSYHDLVWFWNTRFEKEPWSGGYLGCLGGWWGNYDGIEKLPDYSPSTIGKGVGVVPDRTYHIVSGSVEGVHFIVVDGELITYFVDPKAPDPNEPGYFGFGVYHSHAEYSHLKVYRPFCERRRNVYEPATTRKAVPGETDYLVVDLSGGREARKWPVRWSHTAPDLADDACRTTELWLRRVPAGVNGKPFYIGVFETTQRQWELVTGGNPSEFKGGARPVERVSYDEIRGTEKGAAWPHRGAPDAGSFMGILRAKTGLAFDLPHGMDWEIACRAGTTTRFNDGTDGPDIREVARYLANTNDCRGGFCEHTKVGSYRPNALGIHDMHGNVWETTIEWFDPQMRMRRGGSWAFSPNRCGSSDIGGDGPEKKCNDLGFRVWCPGGM